MASSDEKCSIAKVKPMPQSPEELEKEVRKISLLHLRPNAEPSPRAKLCHFMTASGKIKRSPCYTSILLVGVTGVGKSSTVNHLLNTGGAIKFAKTHDTRSATRDTSEFILTVDEPKFEVSDLQLGIVDTPGFSDTVGLKQEACNFYSIKQFYETHPKLSGCYPNLIFLVVPATDTRIEGPNTNLSKSLRCLTQLGLVDQIHPNVVVVLSFCCSIPHNKVAKWEMKLQEKKTVIQRIVFEALNVTAPVVALENNYEEWGLEDDGDFTRLPNDELQPKNLYDACKDVLKESSDHFGLMTLNACFDKPTKQSPLTGHKAETKNASNETLTADERKFVKLVERAAEGGKNDPIFSTAEQYVEEENLNPEQKQEVEELACTLKKMGLEDKDGCTSISKESVEYFYENKISSTGAEMLEKKFGIKKKAVVLDSGDLVGQGYNILTDKPTSAQIMKFETEEKEFGFVLPTCAKIERVNQTQSFQEQFKDTKSFVQSRLNNLNVSLDVQPDVFNMGPRAGFNLSWSKSGSDESSKSGLSIFCEHRMFKVKIANFKEEKNGIVFTNDFQSEVTKLPDKYNKDDPKNRKCFERFFNRFGHFIVSSAYGGGAVEVTVSEQSEKSGNEKKNLEETTSSFPGRLFGFGAEATGGRSSSSTAMSKDFLGQSNVHWFGGSPDLHTTDTLTSQEKMLKWQTSLMVKPTLLKTEMTLEPISTVIGCIDDGKNEASYDALEDLLGGKFKLLASKEEDEKERKKKMEEEKMRSESNTRSGSVEDPDTSGWWISLFVIAAGIVVTGLLAIF